MKFIHAADIHLDSPLVGLQRYEGAPAEQLRGATRKALSNLVELTLDEVAAFLLLAGDLFDGDWKDYGTGLFFLKEMNRLRDVGVPVIWVAGNHDAVSNVTKSLKLPNEIKQLSHKTPETVLLDDIGVAIHGQSFSTRAVETDLAAAYPPATTGFFNIGLLHTSVTGREGHATYAPCSLSTLTDKGYDYWALGHVHAREVLSEDPWVVFPGNIQGRNIRETGEKGCSIVTVTGGAVDNVEHRSLDVLRWHLLTVRAKETQKPDDVLDSCEEALTSLYTTHGDTPLAVRIRIMGNCAAHRALLANPEHWTAEIRALANAGGNGNVWVEKVKFETSQTADTTGVSNDGPIQGLLSALDNLTPQAATVAELKTELRDLFAKLPELRERRDFVDLDDAEDVTDLAESVKQILLAELFEGDERQ
jgi:DNA repair exonuclease SbcCD nuclease subunit